MGINTTEAERITKQLRKNFATYHIIQNQQEPINNNDKTALVSTVKSNQQTKPSTTPKGNEEMSVEIVQDFKQHNASKKLEKIIEPLKKTMMERIGTNLYQMEELIFICITKKKIVTSCRK